MRSSSKMKRPPARKTNGSNSIIYCLIVLCISGAYCHTRDMFQILFQIAVIILFNAIMELIIRIGMLYQEREYFQSHYDRKWELLLRSVLSCTNRSIFAAIASGIVIFAMKERLADSLFFVLLSSAVYALQPLLQFKSAPIYTSHQIETDEIDVGSYMAISFFHGYLKLTLQKQPDSGRGLQHAMEVYEANNGIRFPRKALYILVPRSMHCPHRLIDNSAIMEESKTLEPIEQDIAGVKNRNYKNSVYKIQDKGDLIYVVAEYASPLRTFKESVKTDGLFKDFSLMHRQDIVYKFYTTIVRLVNEDPYTRGLCEFIYFNDVDKNGKPVDIGKVLLKRLVSDVTADKDD